MMKTIQQLYNLFVLTRSDEQDKALVKYNKRSLFVEAIGKYVGETFLVDGEEETVERDQ